MLTYFQPSAENLFQKGNLVVWSYSKIDQITGMLGVSTTSTVIQNCSLFAIPDVEIHHLETAEPLEFSNVSVVSQGPLRAAVRAEVKYGQSNISVTVCHIEEWLCHRLITFFSFSFSDFPRCHYG